MDPLSDEVVVQLIVDWEYSRKMAEGRGEDVAPCVGCNKCHGWQYPPWLTLCTVNPKLAIDSAWKIIDPPTLQKKVAVIGGGPAGLKAAMTTAERGHRVTLYEKTDYLGGMLRHSDYIDFAWPLMKFKDYLARQVKKMDIELRLNTAATPEMIESGKYDAVLLAIGAEPNIPRIPGTDAKNVYDIDSVFVREKEIGKNVVIVRAGSYSIETALHLANGGRKVTVLAGGQDLVEESGPHQLEMLAQEFRGNESCTAVMNALTTSVACGKVTYKGLGQRKVRIGGRRGDLRRSQAEAGRGHEVFGLGGPDLHHRQLQRRHLRRRTVDLSKRILLFIADMTNTQ